MKYSWQGKLEQRIKVYLEGYSACHDFFHMARVNKIAHRIADNIPCDREVLTAACLLHDIGYKGNEDNDKEHHLSGMKIAEEWLQKVNFPAEKINEVVEAIRLHDNFPHMGDKHEKTEHIETLILQDADRIEALGAVGIARTAYYFGERNKQIYNPSAVNDDMTSPWCDHSLLEQLHRYATQKWNDLNFDVSREIARKRHKIMNDYYLHLKEELEI